uniref:DUF4214 domain-containing protein n=1 Tax=Brevundimonas sp. TaxID=1871086 RepID=UPI00286D4B6B
MPTFTGTGADETLTGTNNDDVLIGNGGYDSIIGRTGNDVIDGYGVLDGAEGDDRFIFRWNTYQEARISGGEGFDVLDMSQSIFQVGVGGYTGPIFNIAASQEALVGFVTPFDSRGRALQPTPTFRAEGIERLILLNQFQGFGMGVNVVDLQGRTTPIEVIGGALVDRIRGGSGADILRGGGGNDIITFGQRDQAFGDDGDDVFQLFTTDNPGEFFYASIEGGAGTDTLAISMVTAYDGMVLGNGVDPHLRNYGIENVTLTQELAYNAPTLVTRIVGDQGNNVLSFVRATGATAITTGITIRGAAGNDTITSAGTNDFLYGDEGDDIISGRGRLEGGVGDDVLTGSGELFGGDGADRLTGFGTLSGGAGNDIVTATTTVESNAGTTFYRLWTSQIDGGAGIDTLAMGLSNFVGVDIDLFQGTARGVSSTTTGEWTLTSIENVVGSQATDRIVGDEGANELIGAGGDDNIRGGAGNDIIRGYGSNFTPSSDNDSLYGEAGADRIFGEFGNDLLDGGEGDDYLDGGVGDDNLIGGAGKDILIGGTGSDGLNGGAGDDVLTGGAGLDVYDGGEGIDMVVFDFSAEAATFSYENGQIIVTSPEGREILTGIERLRFSNAEFEVGANGQVITQPLADRIGTDGADRLVGTAGRDNLVGQGGDDVLIGGDNWDVLNGGDGVDTAGYGGLIRAYSVARAGAAFSTVSGGRENGTDNLASVERLSFLDGMLDTDPNGVAAQIYSLYDAALDRAPDQAGLSGWSGRLAAGTTLAQAAQAFATAPEFVQRYGNLSNEDFVKTMYRFSLNREGDAFGISQWKAQLDSGVSRGSVLLSFSEGAEHRNLTAAAVNAGLFVQDDRTIAVARLYDAAFDRVPDQGGIAYWRGTLDTGGSLFSIANAFVSSQEFQDRYGALNNTQFIDQLYRFTLNREADAFGRQVWIDRLNAGTTRAEMVVIFSESVEHVNLTAPTWAGGIRYEN